MIQIVLSSQQAFSVHLVNWDLINGFRDVEMSSPLQRGITLKKDTYQTWRQKILLDSETQKAQFFMK